MPSAPHSSDHTKSPPSPKLRRKKKKKIRQGDNYVISLTAADWDRHMNLVGCEWDCRLLLGRPSCHIGEGISIMCGRDHYGSSQFDRVAFSRLFSPDQSLYCGLCVCASLAWSQVGFFLPHFSLFSPPKVADWHHWRSLIASREGELVSSSYQQYCRLIQLLTNSLHPSLSSHCLTEFQVWVHSAMLSSHLPICLPPLQPCMVSYRNGLSKTWGSGDVSVPP